MIPKKLMSCNIITMEENNFMKRNPNNFLKKEYEELVEKDFDWKLRILQSGSKPHSIVDGKEVIMLCSNNYLNLSNHPRLIEESIKSVGLWEEIKDRLRKSALSLSLEQQQRLCIARVIALKSEIILLDEPCSALDPVATQKIEELLQELKRNYTVVLVTHNMQQAARISDYTGFMLLGELVEFDNTKKIFTNPEDKKTESYITGHFG